MTSDDFHLYNYSPSLHGHIVNLAKEVAARVFHDEFLDVTIHDPWREVVGPFDLIVIPTIRVRMVIHRSRIVEFTILTDTPQLVHGEDAIRERYLEDAMRDGFHHAMDVAYLKKRTRP